jgi:hypothetical protein
MTVLDASIAALVCVFIVIGSFYLFGRFITVFWLVASSLLTVAKTLNAPAY